MNQTLANVADTVTGEAVKIEVDISPKNKMHALFQKWKVLPKKKVFDIHPIKLGSLIRISKLLLAIDISQEDLKSNWKKASYRAIEQHGELMARIIATAIHNRKEAAPESLVKFILSQFSAKELLAVFLVIVGKMQLTDFISSIVSAKGMNMLETSPMTRKETIAPGLSSEE